MKKMTSKAMVAANGGGRVPDWIAWFPPVAFVICKHNEVAANGDIW